MTIALAFIALTAFVLLGMGALDSSTHFIGYDD